jgi:hypothetical protein
MGSETAVSASGRWLSAAVMHDHKLLLLLLLCLILQDAVSAAAGAAAAAADVRQPLQTAIQQHHQ